MRLDPKPSPSRSPSRLFGIRAALCGLLCMAALPALAQTVQPGTLTPILTDGTSYPYPYAVTVDGAGNVYFSDLIYSRVWKLPAGCSTLSCLQSLGGGWSDAIGVAVDTDGTLYVADRDAAAIKKVPAGCTTAACVETLGGGFNNPSGVALGADGTLYVAENANNGAIKTMPRDCTSSACVTVLADTGALGNPTPFVPFALAVDAKDNVYVAGAAGATTVPNAVKEISCTAGGACTVTALGGGFAFNDPRSIAVDAIGNVYVTEGDIQTLLEIPAACISGANDTTCMQTWALDFISHGVALGADGNAYLADPLGFTVQKLDFGEVDFGALSVGTTSPSQTLIFTFVSGGTIGAPFVQAGATDFHIVGGTCADGATFTAGNTCVVEVSFTPTQEGIREGIVALTNQSGAVIATTTVFGQGLLKGPGPDPGQTEPVAVPLDAPWMLTLTGLALALAGAWRARFFGSSFQRKLE